MGTRVAWYRLWVKVRRTWTWICDFQADTHEQAFAEALMHLRVSYQDRPICLEEIEHAPRKRVRTAKDENEETARPRRIRRRK